MSEYPRPETVVRDGMHIDWDVPIEMDDGCTLRCDVYRPAESGRYPVIISHGVYGKLLHVADGYERHWEEFRESYPDAVAATSNQYQVWEAVDPEMWVPNGYAIVRVDSRGAGRSPGYLDVWSERETDDFAECIEWAGEQAWSNGKVGLAGVSYYAMNQWQVAARQPEHLEAICVWEGAADWYRDVTYNGGIYNGFWESWYQRVASVQHGKGENGYRSRLTGDWVSGPETLSEEELDVNRADLVAELRNIEFATDEWPSSRNPNWSLIEVPLLSAGNWGGHGLHLRGNIEGFLRAASEQKWLEIHGGTHIGHFYSDYGRTLQKRFFGHFLKGEQTEWDDQPPVQLQVRHADGTFEERGEKKWPIPRTDWTRYYLHPPRRTLSTDEQTEKDAVTYEPLGDGVTYLTDPLPEETEITGPISARLFIESETEDADLFTVVRAFRPDMEEIVFQGAGDPTKPVAFGWLRASHRKLDPEQSTTYRPFHTHDEKQPLEPGEIYELNIEIWPTSVVLPPNTRLGFSVRGNDYEYPSSIDHPPDSLAGERDASGVGPHRHNVTADRPLEIYGGDVTIHTGPDYPSSVLVPVIPDDD